MADARRGSVFWYLVLLYLLVKLDFTIQVLLCKCSKVLDLLRVVDVHLGHRCVQDCLASRGDILVGLLWGASDVMSSRKSWIEGGQRAVDSSIASVYRDNAFRWVSMMG
jgi:citrate lyase beta subunit